MVWTILVCPGTSISKVALDFEEIEPRPTDFHAIVPIISRYFPGSTFRNTATPALFVRIVFVNPPPGSCSKPMTMPLIGTPSPIARANNGEAKTAARNVRKRLTDVRLYRCPFLGFPKARSPISHPHTLIKGRDARKILVRA